MRAPPHRPPPLRGVRVLDLTMVVAGPYATMLLADWGAEVIRLDTPEVFVPYTRGTAARPTQGYVDLVKGSGYGYAGNTPKPRAWNRYTMFQNQARNKLSMTVDLRSEEGRRTFDDLLAVSDIIVENNVPATLDKLGITWEYVRARRPDVIMLRLPAFGLGGEYENFRAFGSHIEAVAGHLHVRGYPDTDVTMRGILPIADGPSGVGGALAAVMALRHRARTGRGQLVELSQTENFATYLGEAFMEYSMNRRNVEPTGNRHPSYAPHGVYPCLGDDRWVTIAISTDEQWAAFCEVAGPSAPWTKEERFAANAGRLAHHDELDERIASWTAAHDHYSVMLMLQKAGVPAGAVIDEGQTFSDPQLVARGFFDPVTHAECGTHLYPGISFKMHHTPNAIRTPPCRLGEHNDFVYRDLLGTPEAKMDELAATGRMTMDYAPELR